MDWANLGNYMIFFVALLMQVLQSDDSDDTYHPHPDDREAQYPLYDAANYSETVDGTAEGETIRFDSESVAWFAFGGDDTMTGTAGDDFAALGAGEDAAAMGAGDDIVYGGAGNDTISGGDGADMLLGGADDDLISGDAGDDAMSGGLGNDTLIGGSGADTIYGDDGDDLISGYALEGGAEAGLSAADGADQLLGGAGNDTLIMGHGDSAAGGDGADHFAFDTRYGEDDAAMTITDFNPAEDRLEILYTPQFDGSGAEIAPEISLSADKSGENGLISLNGEVVGVIRGQPDLSPDAITLTAESSSTGG